MIQAVRRQWPMIVADLRGAGLSYYKIALTIGVSGHHVKRWGNGVEPGHFHGEKLLALHAELCAPRETSDAATLSYSDIRLPEA